MTDSTSLDTRRPLTVDEPTSVYRYYDENGLLLYVGITSRRVRRNDEHNDKEWWPFVSHQEVDHFPTRQSALDREKALIRRHRPPFNIQHNPGHHETKATYLAFMAGAMNATEHWQAQYARLGHRLPLHLVRRTRDHVLFASAPENRLVADLVTSTDGRFTPVVRLDGGGKFGKLLTIGHQGSFVTVEAQISPKVDVTRADLKLKVVSQKKPVLIMATSMVLYLRD